MNARYYDREIGQFLSPDTIVPDPSNLFDYNRYMYVRGNPMKYTDPTGHTVDWNCWYCNTQWLDYSGAPGWLNRTADNLAVASCFVAGCHVDTEADTIAGPTQEEAAYDMANQLIGVGLTPMGMVKVPGVTMAEGLAGTSAPKLGQLRGIGQNLWESTAGLRYGTDPNPQFGNRIQHVLAHTTDDLSKQLHGVFKVGKSDVLELVDEGWQLVQKNGIQGTLQGTRTVYTVDMGRVIGYVGGKQGVSLGNPPAQFLRLVVEKGNEVITAFPVNK